MPVQQRAQVQTLLSSTQHDEDSQRMKLRSAEGVLVPALFSYPVQEFGEGFFDEAWDEFFLWNDAPDDVEHCELGMS
jgi:hypothetical protein